MRVDLQDEPLERDVTEIGYADLGGIHVEGWQEVEGLSIGHDLRLDARRREQQVHDRRPRLSGQ